MSEYVVRFFETAGPGVGASSQPLSTQRMAEPPARGEGVLLRETGERRWLVDHVDRDLRSARREAVVWVSACDE
ncbi:hypothetical protein Val02_82220 [Virgisporangium aliadipatigenens]|uniref:Uncharacterized protein n=1 Tax=Virgisporangium aliadipatigenens TaxID=741659 RepID=A0A8J3YX29_9ACTN|nr:hypothetical protein [Virgisporangium aliadipatigenens]GIJ51336.1 hypothetical protein Val02_82220 [Virgisporangium aliadipatigenens]